MTIYRTCVYIDGFNLYCSISKQIRDGFIFYPSMKELCENKLGELASQHTIEEINYFTAKVRPTRNDPDKPQRQKNYNDALDKEEVNIILGVIKDLYETKTWRRQWTEKRSDVNLATRFVYDACKNKYDYAVIISRDTDFCGMIEFVSDKFTKKIIDVWTVEEMTRELNEIIKDNKRVKHHRITNDDLIKLTQIAN